MRPGLGPDSAVGAYSLLVGRGFAAPVFKNPTSASAGPQPAGLLVLLTPPTIIPHFHLPCDVTADDAAGSPQTYVAVVNFHVSCRCLPMRGMSVR